MFQRYSFLYKWKVGISTKTHFYWVQSSEPFAAADLTWPGPRGQAPTAHPSCVWTLEVGLCFCVTSDYSDSTDAHVCLKSVFRWYDCMRNKLSKAFGVRAVQRLMWREDKTDDNLWSISCNRPLSKELFSRVHFKHLPLSSIVVTLLQEIHIFYN